jgi:hypothetical protein
MTGLRSLAKLQVSDPVDSIDCCEVAMGTCMMGPAIQTLLCHITAEQL